MTSSWCCGAFLLNGCRTSSALVGQEWSQSGAFKTKGLRPREIVLMEANRNIK